MRCIFFFLLLIMSCGIKGDPIPPNQRISQDNNLLAIKKNTPISSNAILISDFTLNRIGRYHNANTGGYTKELDDLFNKLSAK